jgi:hypothetical protein
VRDDHRRSPLRQKWHEPSKEKRGGRRAKELRRDKTRSVDRTNSGERVCKRARDRDRRIRERGRRSEPVCSRNIQSNSDRDCLNPKPATSPDEI